MAWSVALLSLFMAPKIFSADTPAAADGKKDSIEEPTVVLSPFIVSKEKDTGYKATNSTSGTRLSTPIKDVPMDLEVITSQFIRDTGSSNVRDALRFSGGVVLNSQVDGLVNAGAFDGPSSAGSNDARGATRDPNDTTYKIRGLITDSVLRDGFTRKGFSDSINVDRIEVVRGPSALLYGVGAFGGIVNYIPKRPEEKAQGVLELETGNEGWQRAALDVTGPLTQDGHLLFRLTGALQQNGSFIDLYKEKRQFISPVLSFRPWANTLITFDNEWGTKRVTGSGDLQNIRGVDISNGSYANSRRADFLLGGAVNLRTFNWGGPDEYHTTGIQNHLLTVDQKLADNLYLKAGVQRTHETRGSQVVANAFINGFNAPFDRANPVDYYNGHFLGDILYRHYVYTQIGVSPTDTTAQYYLPPTDQAVLQYQWTNDSQNETRDQLRAEINYKLEAWGTHNFLFGANYQKSTLDELIRSNPRSSNTRGALNRDQIYNFKAIDDIGYFNFARQGYGGPSLPVVPLDGNHNVDWDLGYYAVYHGSFWKNRINLIGGVRHDRTDAANSNIHYDDTTPTWTPQPKTVSAPKKTSPQVGITIKLLPSVSVYAVHSTGVVPNYYLTDGSGAPLPPTQSKNNEIGLKFDLLDGRISGTIAAYKIKRSGTPRFIWWAPNAVRMAQNFNPKLPLAYAIDGVTPGFFDYIKNKPYMQVLDPNHTVGPGSNFTFKVPDVNSPGAQVLNDAVTFMSKSYLNWPGWMFESGYNQALSDGTGNVFLNSPGSNSTDGAFVPIDDENKGWDAQFVFSPTNDWQIVATYAHNENKMTSAYKYVKVPYVFGSQWAIWNFPTFGWGTFNGILKEDAYTDYTDSSTYKGIDVGTGQSLDDTPAHTFTMWNRYDFRHIERLKGFVAGFGGTYESPRKWTNGYATDGTWIAVPGADGKLHSLVLTTKSRLTLSAMVEYTYKLGDKREVALRFNVDNLLDDQQRYGLIYAPGATYKLSARVSF
jgi:outer membrane receptor protein involved in Fe transport